MTTCCCGVFLRLVPQDAGVQKRVHEFIVSSGLGSSAAAAERHPAAAGRCAGLCGQEAGAAADRCRGVCGTR